jgi:hypothetical protein
MVNSLTKADCIIWDKSVDNTITHNYEMSDLVWKWVNEQASSESLLKFVQFVGNLKNGVLDQVKWANLVQGGNEPYL